MDGFVELESDAGHGLVWVRLAHITGIRRLEIHDITGATHHTLSVLAGGEWFSDPVDHATAADAAARADVLAGLGPATGLVARTSATWRRIVGLGRP
jgi:hypothetical protein